MSTSTITDEAGLRACYPAPAERSVRKTLPALDGHMRAFIALSPFLCLGTSGEAGGDVTPRGDAPGWIHVLDDRTILIPDYALTIGAFTFVGEALLIFWLFWRAIKGFAPESESPDVQVTEQPLTQPTTLIP